MKMRSWSERSSITPSPPALPPRRRPCLSIELARPRNLDFGFEACRFHGALRDQQQAVDLERFSIVIGAAANGRTAVSMLPWPRSSPPAYQDADSETSSSCNPSRARALHPDVEEDEARPALGNR